MLPIFLTALLLIPSLSFCRDQGVSRLNFFPDSKAWLIADYTHSRLDIGTPREALQAKEVRNHYNLFSLAYAYRFSRKLFIGTRLGFEEASENAAAYGLPFHRRSTSTGLIDPEIFANYRLRFQKEDRGSIDMGLTLIPSPGPRNISQNTINRFSGKNAIKFHLAHGFLDESWEFRNLLETTFKSAGREENEFLDGEKFNIESTYIIKYAFTTQYSLKENIFLAGTIGIIYRSTETIRESGGEDREIRSGTGSLFQFDLKYTFSDWSLVEVGYALQRREYFVKAQAFNLDGTSKLHQYLLKYVVLF